MHLARQEYKAGLEDSLEKRGIKALAANVPLPCPLVESKMEKPLPWWRGLAVSHSPDMLIMTVARKWVDVLSLIRGGL